jgi:hypothetical protein
MALSPSFPSARGCATHRFPAVLAFAAALIGAAPAASAHYLWLERQGPAARLYFGEVNEVREQSPGRLDDIPAPRAWSLSRSGGSAEERRVQRRTGAFLVDGRAGEHMVVVESNYPVQDWTRHGLGIVKPMFYARYTAWPARAAVPSAPELRLDVQPVPGASNAARVLFDGKPLAGAKLAVHAPNGWDQELKTDAEGRVALPLPWRGQYVLEAIHREPAAGTFQGQNFEAQRHRATLTLVRRDGIDPAGTGALARRHPER